MVELSYKNNHDYMNKTQQPHTEFNLYYNIYTRYMILLKSFAVDRFVFLGSIWYSDNIFAWMRLKIEDVGKLMTIMVRLG